MKTVKIGSSTVQQVERQLILSTLEHFSGNKTKTAAAVGISLKTLYNRLHEWRSMEIA